MESLQVFVWAMVGSVISLVGGALMIGNQKLRKQANRWALPFGAGALLAVAFLSLLPEALDGHDATSVTIATMVGFLIFLFLRDCSVGGITIIMTRCMAIVIKLT